MSKLLSQPPRPEPQPVIDGHQVRRDDDQPLQLEHPDSCYRRQRSAVAPSRLLSVTEPVVSGQHVRVRPDDPFGEDSIWDIPVCDCQELLSDWAPLEDLYRHRDREDPAERLAVGEARLIRWYYRGWWTDATPFGEAEHDCEMWWEFADGSPV